MKKNEKKISSIRTIGRSAILTIVTASIFASSCSAPDTEDVGYNNRENIYGKVTTSSKDVGVQLLNVDELNVNEQLTAYVDVMTTLLEDIISDNQAAALFCSDPGAYLAQEKFNKFGVDLNLYLTGNDQKILLAISDPEILNAAKNNDIKEFIELCNAKNLLTNEAQIFSTDIVDPNQYFKSKGEYELVREYMGTKQYAAQQNIQARNTEACVFGIIVAVVADTVVLDRVHFWGATQELYQQNTLVTTKEPVLKFWQDENKTSIDNQVLFETLIEQRVDRLVPILIAEFPDLDEYNLRQYCSLTLQTYYGLNK